MGDWASNLPLSRFPDIKQQTNLSLIQLLPGLYDGDFWDSFAGIGNDLTCAFPRYERIAPLLDSKVYSVTYSGPDFLEIASRSAHKGEALAAFCTQSGIEAHSVVAFGDMPNDLPMLEWAGLGMAVANAHPLVLQAADVVTLSNEEDGVASLLARIMDTVP